MQSPHPTPEELAAFSLGKLAETDSGEILQHLDDCEDCRSTIDNLADASDTLASALRRPAQTDELAEEPELQLAIAKIHQFGATTPSLDGDSAGDPATQTLPCAVRDYELIGLLGQGGMGAVYKARHRRLKRVVALKVLPASRTQDAAAVARFHREMEAVGRLDHPHIVRAMDAGEDDGKSYLVMEYVRGFDFSQVVKQRGALPMAEACELVRQVAVGLQEAHEHGMVHRDVKPSNLMLSVRKTGPPIVKILDMCLAQLTHVSGGEELTSTGQLMGTLDYMAPEQGGDAKAVDIRADIYSLGATLYKLLTGQPVYHGERYESPMQKMMALATEPAPPILEARSDIPPKLAAIVHRMLEKQPAARFDSPAEVAAALAPFCQGAELEGLLASIATEDRPIDDQSLIGTSPALSGSDSETQSTIAAGTTRPKPADAKPPHSRRWNLAAALGGFGILIAIWVVIKIRDGGQETEVRVPEGAVAIIDKAGNVAIELNQDGADDGEDRPAEASDAAGASPLVRPLVPGDRTTGLLFDGEESHVRVPTLDYDGSHPLTIEATVAISGSPPPKTLAVLGNSNLGGYRVFWSQATWVAQFFYRDERNKKGILKLVCARPALPERTTHLAMVYDMSRVCFFVDGRLEDSRALEHRYGPPQRGTHVFLGADAYNRGNRALNSFSGWIGQIRFSKSVRYTETFDPPRVFSADDNTIALFLFDEGRGSVAHDRSGNGHHGVVHKASWMYPAARQSDGPVAGE